MYDRSFESIVDLDDELHEQDRRITAVIVRIISGTMIIRLFIP